MFNISYNDMKVTNTTSLFFSEDPDPRIERQDELIEEVLVKPLPETWPFTNPHFSLEIPVPSSLSTLGAHAVRLEMSVVVSSQTTGWPGESVPQPQQYDATSNTWDFTIDVGAIAQYVVSASLQRYVVGEHAVRFNALLLLKLFDAFPSGTMVLNIRLACLSQQPQQGTYSHVAVTQYAISAFEYFRRRTPPALGYEGWFDGSSGSEFGSLGAPDSEPGA